MLAPIMTGFYGMDPNTLILRSMYSMSVHHEETDHSLIKLTLYLV